MPQNLPAKQQNPFTVTCLFVNTPEVLHRRRQMMLQLWHRCSTVAFFTSALLAWGEKLCRTPLDICGSQLLPFTDHYYSTAYQHCDDNYSVVNPYISVVACSKALNHGIRGL